MAASVKSSGEAVERLRELRDLQLRNSKEAVDLWEQFVSSQASSLGEEKWLIYEQVFIAALDVGQHGVAMECWEAMSKQFPGSLRLLKLKGMYYESQQKWDKAQEVYSAILAQDPVDAAAQKRQAAIFKAQNKVQEAITKLNEYVAVNCMDFEAWLELCDLYLSQLDYDKAAFCMEELILNNPNNHLYHQRYADIKYSQGDFELARSYYSQAAKLSSKNVRALYGLLLCSQKLAASKGKTKVEHITYARKAAEILDSKFKEAKSATHTIHGKAVAGLMDSLQMS